MYLEMTTNSTPNLCNFSKKVQNPFEVQCVKHEFFEIVLYYVPLNKKGYQFYYTPTQKQ